MIGRAIMVRRLSLVLLLLSCSVLFAWAKWKPDEQKYLDENFGAVREQVQALKAQLDTLTTTLTELRQAQVELQAELVRQQRSFHELEQAVVATRRSSEESFSAFKVALKELRDETQKTLDSLSALPAYTPAGEAAARQRAGMPTAVQGYVTIVQGSSVMVDLGSAQGLRPGSRLAVYKANDPTTRVGVLEVTEVVDAGNSRTRIVTINPGVRPDFADIVRLE